MAKIIKSFLDLRNIRLKGVKIHYTYFLLVLILLTCILLLLNILFFTKYLKGKTFSSKGNDPVAEIEFSFFPTKNAFTNVLFRISTLIKGFSNKGNTCFMNAATQTFLTSGHFLGSLFKIYSLTLLKENNLPYLPSFECLDGPLAKLYFQYASGEDVVLEEFSSFPKSTQEARIEEAKKFFEKKKETDRARLFSLYKFFTSINFSSVNFVSLNKGAIDALDAHTKGTIMATNEANKERASADLEDFFVSFSTILKTPRGTMGCSGEFTYIFENALGSLDEVLPVSNYSITQDFTLFLLKVKEGKENDRALDGFEIRVLESRPNGKKGNVEFVERVLLKGITNYKPGLLYMDESFRLIEYCRDMYWWPRNLKICYRNNFSLGLSDIFDEPFFLLKEINAQRGKVRFFYSVKAIIGSWQVNGAFVGHYWMYRRTRDENYGKGYCFYELNDSVTSVITWDELKEQNFRIVGVVLELMVES